MSPAFYVRFAAVNLLMGWTLHVVDALQLSRWDALTYLRRQWDACDSELHLRAVVFNVETNTDRWDWMRRNLISHGICPARYLACTSSNVEEVTAASSSLVKRGTLYKCHNEPVAGVVQYDIKGGRRRYNVDGNRNYLYNGLTQMKAWADVSSLVPENGWMLFFEDDIAVHPALVDYQGSAFSKLLSSAINVSEGLGHEVAFFGHCNPHCLAGDRALGDAHGFVSYARCQGPCAHAYAFRGSMLQSLKLQQANLIDGATASQQPGARLCDRRVQCVHDPFAANEILRQDCLDYAAPKFDREVCGNLYGRSLVSPCTAGHEGLFYQNRDNFGSNITIETFCRLKQKHAR